MDFRIEEKLMLWISGSNKRFFSTQEVRRKMIFSYYLRNLDSLKIEEEAGSALHKKTMR